MKNRTKKAAVSGRKKFCVTVFGVNTIHYSADIVVEVPADMNEAELIDAIDSNWDKMPEPKWRECDEEGFCRDPWNASVWALGDGDEVPQVVLLRDENGKIVVRP
jgi:hypothetical protein